MEGEQLGCPSCGSKLSRVKETRNLSIRGIHFIKRIRECHHCKFQYHTKEINDSSDETFRPNKRNGSPQKNQDSLDVGIGDIDPVELPDV